MKYKILKRLLFISLCWMWLPGMAQEKVQVRGYMLDESTFGPVPLANILIRNTGTRFVSNRNGFFRINIAPTDSVYITGIGYSSKLFAGKELIPAHAEDTIHIYLRPEVYKLKDVNVVYTNRKRDSIARLAAEFLKNDPLLNNYDRVINRPRGNLMSPLTAMYEEWSKAGQDMRKFEEFLQYAEQQKEVDKRYNKKVIKKITGIQEPDLDAFIMFCRLDREFILQAADYDLYLAIKKCADELRSKDLKERTRLR